MNWIIGLIKNWLCKDELRALERYRLACSQVWRWNGQLPQSSHTAQWIGEVGEGKRGFDIERLRDHLRNGTKPDFRT